jgi:Gpi18-like mannosyltransferase
MTKLEIDREILPVLCWAWILQALIASASAVLPEMGDLAIFKLWANRNYDHGIHRAFLAEDYGYDWLPLYLYVSKAIGMFFDGTGLRDHLGPMSRALSLLLKSTMIGFHVVTAYLVYVIGLILSSDRQKARLGCLLFLWQPGALVATCIYGYQDAFHTLLVAGAGVSVLTNARVSSYAFCVLVALTKPQAAIYLVPFAFFGIRRHGWRWGLGGIFWGLATLSLALSPFWLHGTMGSVLDMYTGVTQVHEWLTGCAHNIWWLVAPVPPFESDRLPVLGGLSGLETGLILFAFLTGAIAYRIRHTESVPTFLEACALFGFGFFMLVTEIHENHIYSIFLFLAPLASAQPQMKRIYTILTGTFAINLISTNLWLHSGLIMQAGFLRLGSVNATVNLIVLLAWLSLFWNRGDRLEDQSL